MPRAVRLTRTVFIAAVCCWMIGGCASGGGLDSYTAQTYVVRPHDTLYTIAWQHNLDYRELAKWNDIGPDFRLAIGQVLVLHPTGKPAHARSSSPPVPPPAAKVEEAGAAPRASIEMRGTASWFD